MQGAQVQFLVRELRSHMLHGAAKKNFLGTSLVVQLLRLHAPKAEDLSLIPGQ